MTDEKAQGVPLSPYMQRREAEEKARAAAEDEYRDGERRMLKEMEASVRRVQEQKIVGGAPDPLMSALHGYEKVFCVRYGWVMPPDARAAAWGAARHEYDLALAREASSLAESQMEAPDNPGQQPRFAPNTMSETGGTKLVIDMHGNAWWVDVDRKTITPALASGGR